MSGISGTLVSKVASCGEGNKGEIVHITFETQDGPPVTLLLPLSINPHAILALMTGGGMAYEEQKKALGEKGVVDKLSFTRFQPSEVQTVQAVNPAGDRRVVLRMKHKGYPAVDVELTLEDARMVADMLLKSANGDQPPAPRIQ